MKVKEADISWLENPEVFAVNRIEAHSDHLYYEREEEVRGEAEMSLRQSLNGSWYFQFAKNPDVRIREFYRDEFPCKGFDRIEVPGHLQTQGYDRCQYINTMYPWDGREELRPPKISKEENPVGSYVKYFEVDEALRGKRTFISFQGVETAFYVWINGKFLGYSEDSFTPSEFEITDFLREGENKLAVEVYKRSSASWLEDQDFWRFSGIFREVYLYAVPEIHVQDFFVKSIPDDSCENGIFLTKLKMTGAGAYRIRAVLRDACGKVVLEKCIQGGENCKIEGMVPAVHCWSAEDPYLYQLELHVEKEDGTLIEIVPQKVGFRRFEMRDGIMCLNGRRIVFKGVNRHEFHVRRGRAVTKEDMLWDIRFLKRHNINAVRTSHYPNQSLWSDR